MIHRVFSLAGLATAAVLTATVVHAVEDGPLSQAEAFRAECVVAQACIVGNACSAIPALGQILLERDADGYQMGRDDATMAPVDHYATLEDAHPLPATNELRRDILVSLPRDVLTRRYALFTQIHDLETGDPILRTRYVTLDCYDVAP